MFADKFPHSPYFPLAHVQVDTEEEEDCDATTPPTTPPTPPTTPPTTPPSPPAVEDDDSDEITALVEWFTEHAASSSPALTTYSAPTHTFFPPFHDTAPRQPMDDAHTSASSDNTFLFEAAQAPTQHQHEVWGVDPTALTPPAPPTWGIPHNTPPRINSWNLSPEARALRDAIPGPNPIPSTYEGSVSFLEHEQALEALTEQLATMTPISVPDIIMDTTQSSCEHDIPNKWPKK